MNKIECNFCLSVVEPKCQVCNTSVEDAIDSLFRIKAERDQLKRVVAEGRRLVLEELPKCNNPRRNELRFEIVVSFLTEWAEARAQEENT